MTRRLAWHAATEGAAGDQTVLPGLRSGVLLIGDGEEAELRDMRLGQVVKLGGVATTIVRLLDGTRTVEQLLATASKILGGTVNPMGLVELLEALDRRALLDTPRARTVVEHGLVRADIAALRRLSHRRRQLQAYEASRELVATPPPIRMASGTKWSCRSCTHCCSEKHLLGPVAEAERDTILKAYAEKGDVVGMSASNFLPIPGEASAPHYLLRTEGGSCVYLGSDGLCRIHTELGEELKPSVCRMFPFRGVRTPLGWDLGMSLTCPTVANGGRQAKEDAQSAAETAISTLRVLAPALHQTPADVVIDHNFVAPYARYSAWEDEVLRQLDDSEADPIKVWLDAVSAVFEMVSETMTPLEDRVDLEETITNPALATTMKADALDDESSVVPKQGVGTPNKDPTDAADSLLAEMALWSELLVGLEAANPDAIRRFRSAMLRLRLRLGRTVDAAPVLAEQARLENRASLVGGIGTATDTERTIELSTDYRIRADLILSGQEADVQRRFLRQALFDKRTLEYSALSRGVLGITLFLAILAMPTEPGDELRLEVSDIAYLSTHPQLTDILDTRATTRRHAVSLDVHRGLLGLAEA